MTNTELIAITINNALPRVKTGTLRTWGAWFGRPYDNCHAIVQAKAENGLLTIEFNEGETLQVWEPTTATIDLNTFRIADAQRVRWEWFYYGRPKILANRYFQDFHARGAATEIETNVDWYQPRFEIDRTLPAAELL